MLLKSDYKFLAYALSIVLVGALMSLPEGWIAQVLGMEAEPRALRPVLLVMCLSIVWITYACFMHDDSYEPDAKRPRPLGVNERPFPDYESGPQTYDKHNRRSELELLSIIVSVVLGVGLVTGIAQAFGDFDKVSPEAGLTGYVHALPLSLWVMVVLSLAWVVYLRRRAGWRALQDMRREDLMKDTDI